MLFMNGIITTAYYSPQSKVEANKRSAISILHAAFMLYCNFQGRFVVPFFLEHITDFVGFLVLRFEVRSYGNFSQYADGY